jgi:hypothetical protein
MTAKELLDNPQFRRADGALTDAAYAAYIAAREGYPGGFIPDSELDRVDVTLNPAK